MLPDDRQHLVVGGVVEPAVGDEGLFGQRPEGDGGGRLGPRGGRDQDGRRQLQRRSLKELGQRCRLGLSPAGEGPISVPATGRRLVDGLGVSDEPKGDSHGHSLHSSIPQGVDAGCPLLA